MNLLQTILQINSVARNETVRHGKPNYCDKNQYGLV